MLTAANFALRYRAWLASSTVLTAVRASATRYVTTAFIRNVTLSSVMISWPAKSNMASRRSS